MSDKQLLDAAELARLREIYPIGMGFGPIVHALIDELEKARGEKYEAIRQSQGYLKHARELIDQNDALRARVAKPEAALEQWRKELCSLCEDTEERCAEAATDLEGKEGAYARGRVREAKSIRKAMGEVIYEDLHRTQGRAPMSE